MAGLEDWRLFNCREERTFLIQETARGRRVDQRKTTFSAFQPTRHIDANVIAPACSLVLVSLSFFHPVLTGFRPVLEARLPHAALWYRTCLHRYAGLSAVVQSAAACLGLSGLKVCDAAVFICMPSNMRELTPPPPPRGTLQENK